MYCVFGLKFMVLAFSALVPVATMKTAATIVAPHLYNTTYCCKSLAIACLAKLLMLLIFFCFSSPRRDYWSLAIVVALVLQCIWLWDG
jgi:hypothetical protein